MKKFLIACILVLFVGCASTKTISKPEVPVPAPINQEEVIKKAKRQLVVEEANKWWKTEHQLFFTIWLSAQISLPIKTDTKKIILPFGDEIMFVWLEAQAGEFKDFVYIIATRPAGKWQVINIIVGPQLKKKLIEAQSKMRITPNEQEL